MVPKPFGGASDVGIQGMTDQSSDIDTDHALMAPKTDHLGRKPPLARGDRRVCRSTQRSGSAMESTGWCSRPERAGHWVVLAISNGMCGRLYPCLYFSFAISNVCHVIERFDLDRFYQIIPLYEEIGVVGSINRIELAFNIIRLKDN